MENDFEDNVLVNRHTKYSYGNIYDIDVSGAIKDPQNYLDDFRILRLATENDVIRIRINSEGGQLRTLIQYCNNINQCKGKVITILEGEAYSAGGALFLHGDECVVLPNTSLMIHEAFIGSMGESSKVFSQLDHFRDYHRNVYKEYYGGFLTEDEINSVIEGKDMWLNADDIQKRLDVRKQIEEKQDTDLDGLTKTELQKLCKAANIKFTAKTTIPQLKKKLVS